MATSVLSFEINGERAVNALQEAGERLGGADGEVLLDLSSVRRIDSNTIRAMEVFAGIAAEKGIKIILRGVNVEVYKVLKLVNLSRKFSFQN